jgi:cobalt/nickel transport system ATP-binding protein
MEPVLESSELVFEIKNVSYAYDGSLEALNQINLTVKSGERLAVLGSNGCGKSTLLKLLDGLYFAGEGQISAFGELLTEKAFQDDAFNFNFRRRVGLVFQESDAQLFMPSVWEEISFAPIQGADIAQNRPSAQPGPSPVIGG